MNAKGITLKMARVGADLSQAEIASALGIHRATYAKWEKDPGEITIDNAKKISDILNRSIDEIFFKAEG